MKTSYNLQGNVETNHAGRSSLTQAPIHERLDGSLIGSGGKILFEFGDVGDERIVAEFDLPAMRERQTAKLPKKKEKS